MTDSIGRNLRKAQQDILNSRRELNMKMRMATKSTTRWIANNLRTNPVPKVVSGLVLGALLITGATMVFGSSQVQSLVYSANVGPALNEQMPYFEETLYNRDQRHQQRVAAAEAEESTSP